MDKAVRGRVALSHDRQVAEGALRGTHPHRLPHQALTNITIILIKYLEVYGDIEEAVVITDRSTGKSRGYGFVSNFLVKTCHTHNIWYERNIFATWQKNIFQVIMSNKEAAERACKEPNPIIDGRKANVNLAILGAKPRGNLTGLTIIKRWWWCDHNLDNDDDGIKPRNKFHVQWETTR